MTEIEVSYFMAFQLCFMCLSAIKISTLVPRRYALDIALL